MNSEKNACANENCQCMVTSEIAPSDDPTESYCGDSCREAADEEETETCACGHPACDTP
jgi:hypothetical protein